ncbi:probable inactive leucine-rich repeat receptor-like protein kinase At3g03770 isoform X1 [Arabidopsis lyrata subsp. lyrata]|uniref:probable inactive leucine-rich repeat receptor-like protein kinase At3g03770 isoform X1 n=1 Tax=Arabidopsis lyrata subsp. lyrata TaxID=81972 RepID=UPI000A29E1C6|nr:probable inactive leucine-rich repeat receptor-like protein kinase At3g03770 isoform X1 [Arabidopsis lyrata subsp. lyrata]|eukprot:XP_020876332.1 probable inactive leucine-rich repeat receptor-like protein kinase At3g03770 isoform X1 [Arabidopsis lyrata subsp. lyrata]
MEHSKVLPLLFLSWVMMFLQSTHQLQNSQTQVLYQLRKHLEFPKALESWGNYYGDLCQIPATAHMSITCQGNSITELKVMGDKLFKLFGMFDGSSLPNHTLSEAFLIDSFVTTLTRLTSLRVLSLVSLGIYGEFPGKIHRLNSLEYLDLSSNYLFGSVPPDISRLVMLQSLMLDGNYFNGSVPDTLDSLTNLTVLSLKNNRFRGPFPSSICRLGRLTNLALSHNEISGKLPDLSKLSHLHMLDLRENHLDSELPVMPIRLVTVLLSKNSFSGEIPRPFGALSQLQHLDLSFNHLTGTPSRFLFSLPNISYLDLASNMLSGKLPLNLTCGGKLGFVDMSNNRFIGTPPRCLAGASGERVVKLGGNCLSIFGSHDQHQEFLCEEAENEGKQFQGRKVGILIAVIGGGVLILVFFVLVILLLCTNRCSCCCSREKSVPQTRLKVVTDNSHTSLSAEVLASARLISQTTKLGAQGVPSCRSFSFEELKEATDDFDSSRFLGEGSLGKLYRGTLENGSSIAIRCLVLSRKFSSQSIRGHLDWMSKLNHPHLLSFLGHCTQTSGEHDPVATILYLVYEYMPNGSYRTHLSGQFGMCSKVNSMSKLNLSVLGNSMLLEYCLFVESFSEKILTWPDRLAILIEIAKAVHFLHTGVMPGSFNNHLKTNNILLDEHKIAKLSDYGVSAIIEENEKLETKSETHKSKKMAKREDDVYNFGFILLESLIGPVPTTKGEAYLLNEMTSFGSQDGRQKIVSPTVLTTSSQESLSIAISIANKCVLLEPSARPSFEDVLWNLQYAAQMQSAADAERKSDTSS